MEIRSLIPVLILLASGMSPAWAGLQDISGDFATERISSTDERSSSESTAGQAEPGGTLGAAVAPYALNRVSGKVGVNIAAGSPDAQSNQVVLDTATQAEGDMHQDAQTTVRTAGNDRSMLAAAMLNVPSNMGINIEPGGGNAQMNVVFMH